jgi:hypothetical protein
MVGHVEAMGEIGLQERGLEIGLTARLRGPTQKPVGIEALYIRLSAVIFMPKPNAAARSFIMARLATDYSAWIHIYA